MEENMIVDDEQLHETLSEVVDELDIVFKDIDENKKITVEKLQKLLDGFDKLQIC